MKLPKRICLICLILLLVGCLAGQVQAGENKLPLRVVSLSPLVTENIYLLGAQDRLAANTIYCNLPPEARLKEKVGSMTHANVEKILGLKSDLVIACPLTNQLQMDQLAQVGIRVVQMENPKTFEMICRTTMTLGEMLGCRAQAKDLVLSVKKKAADARRKTKGLKPPRVFIQVGMSPLKTATGDSFISEYIRYCGGTNISAGASSKIITVEEVVVKNPEVILIATMGSSKGAGRAVKNKWLGYKVIQAVKDGRVHILDPEIICSPTPASFFKAIEAILPLIHPHVKLDEDKENNAR